MVRITTDSTADLGELFTSLDIPMLPLIVTLGSDSFYDGVTINPKDIFSFVEKEKILPKTAARSVEDFYDFFKQFTDNGEEVVHINISSGFSATHNHAIQAAKRLEKVYVIDSKSLSSGTGLLVLYAHDLAKEGYNADEIYDKTQARIPFVQASFVVDTMEYLKKGGRCSGIISFAASVLKIKPTILVKDGLMTVGKKYMGTFDKIITKYVEDTLTNFNTPDLTRIFITHTYSSLHVVESVKSKILEMCPFAEVLETKAGSTITSHCGKNTLGILFINDKK